MTTFTHSQAIQSKIIPPDKHDSKHSIPYVYRIEGRGKTLHYIGSSYPTDLTDPTFFIIDDVLEELQPNVTLIGNAKPMPDEALKKHNEKIIQGDLATLVKQGADIAYLTRRAVELGIKWLPLEPADSEVNEYFESQGFSKEEIFVFLFIRNLINYQQKGEFADFEEYKSGLLTSIASRNEWQGFDFSEANLLQQIEKVYGRRFTLEELLQDTELKSLGFPNHTPYFMSAPSAVNKIRNLSWAYRDKYAVEIIAREVQEHDRMLVLFGSSHAVVQEPALRELLK